MKILKRNYRHRNQIIFLMLSLVFLQAIFSLSVGQSIFSLASFRTFFLNHYIIICITAIAIYMVINLKKYSEFAVFICLSFIVGKNFILLSSSFNKLTLALNFIYLVFAFYFFVTWELEIGLASFNPHFSKYDLEKDSRFKLEGKITSINDEVNAIKGCITNLDNESCFLILSENSDFEINTQKKYRLEISYEGVTFVQNAKLVATYDRGIGLVFEEDKNNRVSWSELHKVCLERGLFS